jgi:uncharacterized protein YaaQ
MCEDRQGRSAPSQKLLLIVVSDEDADVLMQALVAAGHPATKVSSTGGFLRRGSATIISGIDAAEVGDVMGIVRQKCRARTELVPTQSLPPMESVPVPEVLEVRVGGAVVFVIPCERIEKM